MLATTANVWRPRLNRKVVTQAKTCPQYQQVGKNIKTVMKQKQKGNILKCTESWQETAIDFTGPFQNAIHAKKYMIVSIE